MNTRLTAARRLKKYADGCKEGTVARELALKCYHSCVMGALKKNSGFSVTFKAKHFHTFLERVKNFSTYMGNNIKAKLFLKSKKFYDCSRPLNLKLSNTPNEWLLEDILNECGFKIKEEHMNLHDITYDIVEK